MGVIGIIFGSSDSAAGLCSTGSKTHETNKRMISGKKGILFVVVWCLLPFLSIAVSKCGKHVFKLDF